MRKVAFAPVVSPGTRVLVLGSLPGDASLAAGQYYAHPRNQFWPLIGAVLDYPDLAARPYPDRLTQIADRRIGLWDVLASAHRIGSLDTAIREAELAPLADLAASLPNLRAIAFNGAKAAKLGRQANFNRNLALIDLPSSSPAHAALSLEEKRERWLAIAPYLA